MEYRGRALQMQAKKRTSGRHLPVHQRTLQSAVLPAAAVILIMLGILFMAIDSMNQNRKHQYVPNQTGWYGPEQHPRYAYVYYPWKTQSRILVEGGLIWWEDIEK